MLEHQLALYRTATAGRPKHLETRLATYQIQGFCASAVGRVHLPITKLSALMLISEPQIFDESSAGGGSLRILD